MLWVRPPWGDCMGARPRTPAPGRRRCAAAGLRPRPGGERAPPLDRAVLRRPLGRQGKMAGRPRRGARRGPREGERAHLVEGAAPARSRGPRRLLLPGWGRRGPFCRVSRAEVRRGSVLRAPPPPISISLFWGEARAVSSGGVGVVGGCPPSQPTLACYLTAVLPAAVNLRREQNRAIRPWSTPAPHDGEIACFFHLGQVGRFKETR